MTTESYAPDNIFAKIIKGDIPSHKVYEDDKTLVFMDILPASRGHCLAIPKSPSRNLLDISEDDLATLMAITKKVALAAMKALDADGITLRQNNEEAGGQEVFHTHFHIMPRYNGEPLRPQSSAQTNHPELAELASKIAAAIE